MQYDINTKTANLVNPLRYIKEPCDKMYHFETKYGLDQTLSPEHIMLFDYYYHRKDEHYFKTMTAEEFKTLHENEKFDSCHNKIPTTFYYGGNGIDLTDDEIKIMCAVICDGSFYGICEDFPNRPSYMRCRFHIKKDRKKEALRELFTKANIWWEENHRVQKDIVIFILTHRDGKRNLHHIGIIVITISLKLFVKIFYSGMVI